MTQLSKREAIILFLGDIFFFTFSLWLSLFVRYIEWPSWALFLTHIRPFSALFLFWLLTYFIAGLYEKHTLIIKSKLPSIIFNSQIINSIFAVVFFYTIPVFGIAPKTILFIYLFISFVFVLFWRLYGTSILGAKERQPALLVGSGAEMKELLEEVNNNSLYGINFISSVDIGDLGSIDIQKDIVTPIYENSVKIVVVDFSHEGVKPLLPHLYNLIFSKVKFIDSHRIYEDIFNRIPLSLVNYSWFLENISVSPKFTYDFLKRLMDIILSFIIGLFSLVLYPFIYLAIKLDDGGKVFITQERMGQNNHLIKIVKFRSMSVNDSGDGEAFRAQKVTSVGRFIRASRIDELPQLWNIFVGDISLIGPRPEMPKLVELYEKEISFYNIRHLIKPGLSGWAQIYQKTPPKFSTDYDQTKTKLSYDLFYIKNRSFWLDIKIALKTIRELVSRRGV